MIFRSRNKYMRKILKGKKKSHSPAEKFCLHLVAEFQLTSDFTQITVMTALNLADIFIN